MTPIGWRRLHSGPQAAWRLAGRNRQRKKADRCVENAGDRLQATGADTVYALLILLDLLEGDAQSLRKLILGQANRHSPATDACADVQVDRVGSSLQAGISRVTF